jgi:serine/threonine protein kinase
MVTRDHRLKILDWGIAKVAQSETANNGPEMRTDASLIPGTVPYMSPEQARRRSGDVRPCHGVILADSVAQGGDGQERARGTNVFVFNSTGHIEAVTGFWSQHP